MIRMSLDKNNSDYENPLRGKFTPDFFKNIPKVPGVYFMLSVKNSILYIGKAKNLRNRILNYARARPGSAQEHTLEMIENIENIRWYQCNSEQHALSQELELLHAIRPPYNIAHTEAEHYLFIGIRYPQRSENSFGAKRCKIDLQLSSHEWIQENGYSVFGCFKNRKKTKMGYAALLRLIYASTFERKRFYFPAKIARSSPPWLYSIYLPPLWLPALNRFLTGTKPDLLDQVMDTLLSNEFIPYFMYRSIQEDFDRAKDFFESGPKYTFEMKQKYKIDSLIITHEKMDLLLTQEFNAKIVLQNNRNNRNNTRNYP